MGPLCPVLPVRTSTSVSARLDPSSDLTDTTTPCSTVLSPTVETTRPPLCSITVPTAAATPSSSWPILMPSRSGDSPTSCSCTEPRRAPPATSSPVTLSFVTPPLPPALVRLPDPTAVSKFYSSLTDLCVKHATTIMLLVNDYFLRKINISS